MNGTKLILDVHGKNLASFRISLESFRSFRGPLIFKTVTGQKVFFAVSYSKSALARPKVYESGQKNWFRDFVLFGIEGQNLVTFLENKNQSYQHVFIFLNEKNLKDLAAFWKAFKIQNSAIFDLCYQIDLDDWNILKPFS